MQRKVDTTRETRSQDSRRCCRQELELSRSSNRMPLLHAISHHHDCGACDNHVTNTAGHRPESANSISIRQVPDRTWHIVLSMHSPLRSASRDACKRLAPGLSPLRIQPRNKRSVAYDLSMAQMTWPALTPRVQGRHGGRSAAGCA